MEFIELENLEPRAWELFNNKWLKRELEASPEEVAKLRLQRKEEEEELKSLLEGSEHIDEEEDSLFEDKLCGGYQDYLTLKAVEEKMEWEYTRDRLCELLEVDEEVLFPEPEKPIMIKEDFELPF